MINAIDNVVNAISGVLYKPYIVPLFLVLAGVIFTARMGLIQFRLFGESIRVIKEKPTNLDATFSFYTPATAAVIGAIDALRDYEKQRAAGKNPVYRAADNGVKDTDFWN